MLPRTAVIDNLLLLEPITIIIIVVVVVHIFEYLQNESLSKQVSDVAHFFD